MTFTTLDYPGSGETFAFGIEGHNVVGATTIRREECMASSMTASPGTASTIPAVPAPVLRESPESMSSVTTQIQSELIMVSNSMAPPFQRYLIRRSPFRRT